MAKPETIVITNFGGRLTRIINGDLNSGFAKFNTSWGYDPFSKPMNLTWFSQPASISALVTDCVLDMKPRIEGNTNYVYAIGQAGKLYKFLTATSGDPVRDSVVQRTSVVQNSPTFAYGASMEFFGSGSVLSSVIYISSDNGMNRIRPDGSGETAIGAQFATNSFKKLKVFQGKLLFGNANTFGVLDSTGTLTSSVIGTGWGNLYSQINPPLPMEVLIKDIDVSPQGDYAMMTANELPYEAITPVSDRLNANSANSFIVKWNGIDTGITAFQSLPSNVTSALQTYLSSNMFFSQNAFGGNVNDGVTNFVTLPNNRAPLPNATAVNGNFLTWVVPEVNTSLTSVHGAMYYFGALDNETPKGLYRVMRYTTPLSSGNVFQMPANLVVNNQFAGIDQLDFSSIISKGYGKHFFSTIDVSTASVRAGFWRFVVNANTLTPPQLGVYETQTQLFSKRQSCPQVRVYCEPTVAGNGFQLDLIDVDGSVLSTHTYNFASGTDITKLQGALERINFNPKGGGFFGLGVRITNTGTTNMCIKKVELDIAPEGK